MTLTKKIAAAAVLAALVVPTIYAFSAGPASAGCYASSGGHRLCY
jgi:hypothetical protein